MPIMTNQEEKGDVVLVGTEGCISEGIDTKANLVIQFNEAVTRNSFVQVSRGNPCCF